MVSLSEKLAHLRELIEMGDISQFEALMKKEAFISDLPKRSPELYFLMYQAGSHPKAKSRDEAKINKLLDAAVSGKYAPALAEKGRLFLEDYGIDDDAAMKAEDCFRLAIEESDMARFYLSKIHALGLLSSGGQPVYDLKEAKEHLEVLVEKKRAFYKESVMLMANVILKLKDISVKEEVFFANHVSSFVEKGSVEAMQLLFRFNIITMRAISDKLNYQNDKQLGDEYFTKQHALAKMQAYLDDMESLIIKC